MAAKPRIAVTMGDPAGVGPELCLRLFDEPSVLAVCEPVVYGDGPLLEQLAGRPVDHVVQVGSLGEVQPGAVSFSYGLASYAYVNAAIAAALAGEVAAVCTLPVHKEAWYAACLPYPGHTELFAARTRTGRYCMALTSEAITCSLVTVHVDYRDVPSLLTTDRIVEVCELTADFLRRLRGREPRLTVCGLNPHAGEHGQFGDGEEERVIAPAVEEARRRGLTAEGPLPPDTAFVPARRERTDGYVCMYHDQGLIPLKALAFDSAVNVTLGLPIVRTSVDHGTAFDIARMGVADPSSLFHAVRLAARLATSR
jgi:4-hydroxythreonine-4-phosphate dehydrogenase